MKKLSLLAGILATSLTASVWAAGGNPDRNRVSEQTETRQQVQTQDQERIYGVELMTAQERRDYQAQMRALNTQAEREAFRLEHHNRMQERARALGKSLPDSPPPGLEMGPGPGPGRGMGPAR